MKTRSAVVLTLANLALAVVVHLAWPVLPSGAAVKRTAPLPPQTEEEHLIGVISKASPAVVSILVEAVATKDTSTIVNGQPVDQSTTGTDYQEVGRGTGFLVSADGLIVTNRHVASDHTSRYTIFLSDDRTFTAKVIDIDPVNDLALLKIDATKLPYLTIAPNDNTRIGQVVIAIGNALGKYDNTVTRGILSGVNRSIDAADDRNGRVESLEDILQTDAAINSGNSGGPLLDSSGFVIGVNTALESDAQGLGFAIPASEVRSALASYARFGSIARPRLGLRYMMITPDIALQQKLSYKEGALAVPGDDGSSSVVPGSPASEAGIHDGDIILEANGQKLAGKLTLTKVVQSLNVGDQLKLKIARGDTTFEVTVPVDAYPPVSP